jgi:hypothetical protein
MDRHQATLLAERLDEPVPAAALVQMINACVAQPDVETAGMPPPPAPIAHEGDQQRQRAAGRKGREGTPPLRPHRHLGLAAGWDRRA